MPKLEFVKYHGLGNDFIVVDDLEDQLELTTEMIRAACDRHFGVGADGLIITKRGQDAGFAMDFYNADGSSAQMCGNGIRVLAMHIYQTFNRQSVLKIATGAGIKTVNIKTNGEQPLSISVDMGEPEFSPGAIPMMSDSDTFIGQLLSVNDSDYAATALSMGNPHCVILVQNINDIEVESIGPAIETLSLFPQRTNVEFVQVDRPDLLRVRVWERGVGETLACGTGACAALIAAHLADQAERSATIKLLGGELNVEWNRDNRIILTGSATRVFSGEFQTDNWPNQGVKD